MCICCALQGQGNTKARGSRGGANMHMCELFHQQHHVCLPSGLPISLPQPGTQAGDQAASHAEASGAQDHQGQESYGIVR